MSCSPARLVANRLNALSSTGPRTARGKAASRRNAFKHGLAGEGDVIGPDEDRALICTRAASFAEQLEPRGPLGWLLVERAALLSARMERAAARELVAVARGVEAARDQFDGERSAELVAAIEAFWAAGPDCVEALLVLETAPEGVQFLIKHWGELVANVRSPQPAVARRAADRASRWLDRGALGAEADIPADLEPLMVAELARVRRLADTIGDLAEAIDQVRDEAGLMASFDPSREATLARRYEAAAERGMYRAIREIIEHNARLDPSPKPAAHPGPPPVAPKVPPAPAPRATPAPEPLASFRAGGPAPPADRPSPPPFDLDPAPGPLQPRPKRPDLARIDRHLAPNRR